MSGSYSIKLGLISDNIKACQNILTIKQILSFKKVLLLTAVSNDISQANVKAVIDARNDPRNRQLLRQSSSMAFQPYSDDVR